MSRRIFNYGLSYKSLSLNRPSCFLCRSNVQPQMLATAYNQTHNAWEGAFYKLPLNRRDFSQARLLGKNSILFSNGRKAVEQNFRYLTTSKNSGKEALPAATLKKALDQLTDKFMEARELIDDARESMETVYFSEDMKEAQDAVKATLDEYQNLLEQLSDDQRQEVLRTIGLRMEELKAQEQAIKDALH